MDRTGLSMVAVPVLLGIGAAISGGVAAGVPVARILEPTPIRRGRNWRKFDNRTLPVSWEWSLLLLVAVAVSVRTLFPDAWPAIRTLLTPLWLVGGSLFAVRMALMLLDRLPRWRLPMLQSLLTAVSLAMPVVWIQTITVLATNDADLLDHAGLMIALGAVALSLSIALWGGWYYRPGATTQPAARYAFWLALLLSLGTFPLALLLDGSVMGGRSVMAVVWPLLPGAGLAIASLASEWRQRYFVAASILTASLGVSLFLLQWPYVLRPVMLMSDVLTSPAGLSQFGGGGVAMVVIIGAVIVAIRQRNR